MKTRNRIENIIKVFGMTNQVISQELTEIENKYKIDLGHFCKQNDEDEYYDQFEQDLRIDAAKMGIYYEMFYCLERSIRRFVSENMAQFHGVKWWDSGKVPQEVSKEVANRIQKEIDTGITRRSEDPLDYTTFGELSVVITSNWDVFASSFNSKKGLERILSSLNTLRNPIAHCSMYAEDEIIRLKLAIKDWFRIME